MFLKSIEIRGFKSFADKTELLFKKGITAVVGPNGSGKSNISDAVRWVLGEQSVKSLRGGKMEDVIFAGTQFRKPVGLSQVSLTLDNSSKELNIDYSDITVSRRLYRSGESEYYINNTQCRLRDIQELFMDTGIGKEGYSIIGQGKIDAILSGRPEERRGLLEEAAGIVKYKTRKEEAEKKLQNTEQNFIRINDILSTYEERLEPLRVDMEKAKEFLKISEELKTIEVNIIIHSIDKVKEKTSEIKEKLNAIGNEVNDLLENKLSSKLKLDNWNNILEQTEEINKAEKQTYHETKSKHQAMIAENVLITERLENLTNFINRSAMQIQDINVKLINFNIVKEEQETKLKNLQDEQLKLNSEIDQYEKEMMSCNSSFSKEDELLKKFKNDTIEIASKISETKNYIMIIENNRELLEKKLESLKLSLENYQNSLKINSNTKAMLEEEVSEIEYKVNECEKEIKWNKESLSEIHYNLSKDEKQLKELSITHNKLEANYQMLKSLDKQYEGYNKSVKNLMQHIANGSVKNVPNSCFVLGEIIKVKKELEVALEIALGGAISDIITEDEKVAKFLIGYLKEHNLGRATFLPLTIIKGKKITDLKVVKNISGFIGLASELVEYDFRYTNAVEYVLGRTVIASDMTSALEIAKKANYGFKIVTLAGEIINVGGSLTGGSIPHRSANIITRKREIEEIDLKLKDLDLEIMTFNNRINLHNSEVKKLNDLSLNLKDEIHHHSIEITKIQGKISVLDSENNNLIKSLSTMTKEIELAKVNLKTNDRDLVFREIELKEFIKNETENKSKISEMEAKLKESLEKISYIREKLTTYKIQKAQIDEVVINKIKELERVSRDFDELLEKNKLLEEEMKDGEKNKAVFINSISINKEKIESLSKLITSLEKAFEEKEIEIIELKKNMKNLEEELEHIMLILRKKEDEIHKQDLVLTKIESEETSLYLKLNEEYNFTYAEALKYKSHIDNIDSCRRKVSDLKNKISTLGVVNLSSIEEYKEVKEKFTFMNNQKEDLMNAKNELLNVINDMTKKMKEVFNENFIKLRENFNETFKELFKGGTADLILAEGDVLTSNIDISVQPPGKKLQNINLMSGGEKVLSAIALLFAILKMKPTPFCILDEIEAALDDANVLRYAEFLKKLSNNVQFIVITHRKGTMEFSDILYGVTMEEKGVSKIVSVDLNRKI